VSNDDFDALIALIGAMVHSITAMQDHPNDGPRQESLSKRQDEMIEEFRERLVL
jgi:hypothetical protein